MSEKMPVSRRILAVPFPLKAISAVVLSTALLTGAHATGLGRINVLSALGQPLQAEIELHSTTKEQAEALKIRLASLETFRAANIEYNPVLSALRFTVEERNGKPIIRVNSTRPINEPFVDLLLEVEGSGNRLIREYTFILDPIDLRRPQPVQMAGATTAATPDYSVSAPAPSVSSSPRPAVNTSSVSPAPTPDVIAAASEQRVAAAQRQNAAPAPEGSNADAVKEYTVERGDTLGKIAREVAPEGVSLDQMLVALYRANPQAFSGANMNRLRTGRILTVPDAEAVQAVPQSEARRIVVAQANDFNQYKERLASQVAMSSPVAGDEASQSASGKISTQVEELGAGTATAKDRLQLSKSGIANADAGEAGAIPMGAEERIALEKALTEEKQRVAELEKNLTALQRLLELKNQELADTQNQQVAADVAEQPAIPAIEPGVATAAEQQNATSAPVETASAEAGAVGGPAQDAVAPNAETPAPVAEAPAPAAKPKAPVVAQQPVLEEPSLLDHILGHPLLLPLTGILAALGLVGSVVRRRRKQQEALARDSFVQGNSLFGSTGGQSVDTNNSVFSTNFSPSASQLDTNEVDPIAEADVYIAYQKDDQAEEILKDALRTQPARHNVRLKLLEIYHRRKDAVTFAACAHELQALTGGQGEEWRQAMEMGRELDPSSPLYSDFASQASREQDDPATEGLDLGALLNSTRLPQEDEEGQQASFSMASGGMAFSKEVPKAVETEPEEADNGLSALNFDLGTAKGQTNSASLADTADSEPSLVDWDVDQDIAQMKAAASKPDDEITFAVPEANENDLDVLSILDSDQAAADKPLEFDLSDISLELPVAKSDVDEEAAEGENSFLGADVSAKDDNADDHLAELISPLPMSEADETEAEEKADKKPEAPEAMPELSMDFSFDISEEPLLNLDVPDTQKSAPREDRVALSSGTPASSYDDGEMWEESQDEVALAQPSIPLPSRGPISAETELSTKLDLAVAYREIGDKEGARELLEEVIASGHSEYAEKAQGLLQKIA
jgi:pilus assembly protein FimV